MTPILRFHSFKGDWQTKKLCDVSLFASGGTPSKADSANWGGDIPWISATSMRGHYFSTSERCVTDSAIINGAKLVPEGTILLLVRGSMLFKSIPVGITTKDVTFNQDVKAVFVDDQFNKLFFLNWFFSQENTLLNMVVGTGIGAGKLDTDELKALAFCYPSIDEQQKIADFLSAVDKKISLLKQKHSLLQQYKKGVMQQLFSQLIRFKDENGKAFPNWQEKSLAELADKISNKNKDDVIKNVLTNSAKHGIVNQRDYFDKDIANENNLTNYSIVDKDDFVYNPRISESAPVGPIKRNHIGQGIMSPLYTVFRFKDAVYLDYLELFFQTTYWHRYMSSIANYGARHDRMNITMGDFFKLPVKLPCSDEMQKIVAFVTSLNKKVDLVAKQIELTQTFKKGLLQQMFV